MSSVNPASRFLVLETYAEAEYFLPNDIVSPTAGVDSRSTLTDAA